MRIKPAFPPSSSIVSSWFWEGYLAIEEGILGSLGSENLNELNTIFTGKNDFKKIESFCGTDRSFHGFLNCLEKLTGDADVEIHSKIDLSNNMHVYGTKEFISLPPSSIKKTAFSLQIMKVDRYQGISSIELGTISSQLTPYSDPYATLLLMVGVLSSFSIRLKSDHYFVLFTPGEIATVEANLSSYYSFKKTFQNELRDAISNLKGWMEEYVYLRMIFNKNVIQKAKESLASLKINSIDLRIIRIAKEGQTHKVYVDLPIEINLQSKLYSDPALLETTTDSLSSLSCYASRFLMGKDAKGAGYHAYTAIKKLYMYTQTLNPTFLTEYNREIATMRDIISSDPSVLGNCRSLPHFIRPQ